VLCAGSFLPLRLRGEQRGSGHCGDNVPVWRRIRRGGTAGSGGIFTSLTASDRVYARGSGSAGGARVCMCACACACGGVCCDTWERVLRVNLGGAMPSRSARTSDAPAREAMPDPGRPGRAPWPGSPRRRRSARGGCNQRRPRGDAPPPPGGGRGPGRCSDRTEHPGAFESCTYRTVVPCPLGTKSSSTTLA
jgi:hypothetical protein